MHGDKPKRIKKGFERKNECQGHPFLAVINKLYVNR